MFLIKGAGPFIVTGTMVIVGLCINYFFNKRKNSFGVDSAPSKIGNAVAMLGFIFGFHFRNYEITKIERGEIQPDGLPGIMSFAPMLVLYIIAIWFLSVYLGAKNVADPEAKNKYVLKNTLHFLLVMAALVAFQIFVYFSQG